MLRFLFRFLASIIINVATVIISKKCEKKNVERAERTGDKGRKGGWNTIR